MDRELWTLLLAEVRRAAARVGWNGGRRRPVFSNGLIVALYCWSVWHDRPLSWACDRAHYNGLFRPRRLPSVSQFTRRVRSEDCQRVLRLTHDAFAQRTTPTPVGSIDAKPLTVGPVSKDPDATRGRISGGYGRGYKLHAFVNAGRRVVVWSVMGLNADEKTVAERALLPGLPPLTSDALVLADSNYDSKFMHKRTLGPLGIPLLHPLRNQRLAGGRARRIKLQQMGHWRRTLVRVWQEHPHLLAYVMKARNDIERVFGVLTCTAGGLGGLPPWVRRLERVRRWVGVKVILYNVRVEVRERRQKTVAA